MWMDEPLIIPVSAEGWIEENLSIPTVRINIKAIHYDKCCSDRKLSRLTAETIVKVRGEERWRVAKLETDDLVVGRVR